MKTNALITFFLIGACSMIGMSIHYLQVEDTGILANKEVAARLWYFVLFRTHVLFGIFAITFGPTQFSTRLRKHKKQLHKGLGYLYFISVLLSSLTGLFVAPFAMGGWISATGFFVLGLLWFFITLKAMLSIRGGDFRGHQKWAYFSYALTFAAITQRTLLLIPLLTSVPFLPIYQLSAWLPWLLNLSIAYYLLKSRTVASAAADLQVIAV